MADYLQPYLSNFPLQQLGQRVIILTTDDRTGNRGPLPLYFSDSQRVDDGNFNTIRVNILNQERLNANLKNYLDVQVPVVINSEQRQSISNASFKLYFRNNYLTNSSLINNANFNANTNPDVYSFSTFNTVRVNTFYDRPKLVAINFSPFNRPAEANVPTRFGPTFSSLEVSAAGKELTIVTDDFFTKKNVDTILPITEYSYKGLDVHVENKYFATYITPVNIYSNTTTSKIGVSLPNYYYDTVDMSNHITTIRVEKRFATYNIAPRITYETQVVVNDIQTGSRTPGNRGSFGYELYLKNPYQHPTINANGVFSNTYEDYGLYSSSIQNRLMVNINGLASHLPSYANGKPILTTPKIYYKSKPGDGPGFATGNTANAINQTNWNEQWAGPIYPGSALVVIRDESYIGNRGRTGVFNSPHPGGGYQKSIIGGYQVNPDSIYLNTGKLVLQSSTSDPNGYARFGVKLQGAGILIVYNDTQKISIGTSYVTGSYTGPGSELTEAVAPFWS